MAVTPGNWLTIMNPSQKTGFIEGVFADLLQGQTERAQTAITTQWPRERLSPSRKPIPPAIKVKTFVRDKFQCRYCGCPTIYLGALRLLSHVMPQEFPYHKNWKRGVGHPAYWEISTSCDHLIPVSRGGDTRLENLVTSCYRCHSMKGEWLLEECTLSVREPSSIQWDGLMSRFIQLMDHHSIQHKSLMGYYREAQQAMRMVAEE